MFGKSGYYVAYNDQSIQRRMTMNNVRANISTFERLQANANRKMGASGTAMSVFNSIDSDAAKELEPLAEKLRKIADGSQDVSQDEKEKLFERYTTTVAKWRQKLDASPEDTESQSPQETTIEDYENEVAQFKNNLGIFNMEPVRANLSTFDALQKQQNARFVTNKSAFAIWNGVADDFGNQATKDIDPLRKKLRDMVFGAADKEATDYDKQDALNAFEKVLTDYESKLNSAMAEVQDQTKANAEFGEVVLKLQQYRKEVNDLQSKFEDPYDQDKPPQMQV
jgi:hypothetical protein